MTKILPLIGMSPGNSYFKHKEIAHLLRETIKTYDTALIMVADVPAKHTYEAMGYVPQKAWKKARLQGNGLKNKTKSIIDTMGIDSSKVIIINRAEEVETNPIYQSELKKIQTLFSTNSAFHQSVLDTSEEVLKYSGKTYSAEDVTHATHYLLSEIAFIEFTVQHFGVDQVLYTYHKPLRVYEDYIAGIFDGNIKHHLDFSLLEAPYETYLSPEQNTQNRLQTIKQRGYIQCGYTQYHSDFFAKTDTGFTGRFYDTIMAIGQHIGVEVRFTEQSGYGVINQRINDGAIDIFCAPVRPTKNRRLEMFFTQSLGESHVYGYSRADNAFSTMTFDQLQQSKDLRIVVKENDIHHDIVNQYFPHARIVRLPQLSPIGTEIEYIQHNQADLAFWDEMLTQSFCQTHGYDYHQLHRIDHNQEAIQLYDNCMALPRGEFELKEIVDQIIQTKFN